ncbi:NAD-dependent epimerase/dehydratase family protein [Aurantiacibacter suaedae]|uniref:NAD-dependent epimerase/dehydratase family protein n=1 Tax=Aurantiacibacter suaedae TaxID=2545755 RepID=UPI00240E6239|nr:NAD(P)H-binding protein [Aurantiacibacter suaedae]
MSGVVAITGATGFVGQAVMDEAARRGIALRALTRREQKPRDNVTWVRGDLADHAALAELARGAGALLHIAGVVNGANTAAFEAGNIEGTRAVVAAAQTADVGRFICVSSIAAREPGLSDYCRTKREAEELAKASGLDWTVVRPPAVYGPRDTEMFQLFRAARFGLLPMPPEGRLSVIHVEDLARLLLDVVPGGEGVSGRIFEPDDGTERGWRHHDFAKAVGRALGRDVWAPAMPASLLATLAKIDRAARGPRAKLTPDRVRYMVHPDWVSDAARAVPRALWQPAIATPEGLAQTVGWYRAQGWL